MQTEFEFELPRGYVDEQGQVQRRGIMRLATAIDEIAPLRDRRVRANEAYLTIIVLSRVITKLGSLTDVTPHVIEGLFSTDLNYLQDLYQRLNDMGQNRMTVVCPACDHRFEVKVPPLGE